MDLESGHASLGVPAAALLNYFKEGKMGSSALAKLAKMNTTRRLTKRKKKRDIAGRRCEACGGTGVVGGYMCPRCQGVGTHHWGQPPGF